LITDAVQNFGPMSVSKKSLPTEGSDSCRYALAGEVSYYTLTGKFMFRRYLDCSGSGVLYIRAV
jgi:hypothetical protein